MDSASGVGGGVADRNSDECIDEGGEALLPRGIEVGAGAVDGLGQGQGEGEWETGGSLPEDPLLEAFFPRGTELHDQLFFRVGDGPGDILPFNERVSEARY